MKGVDHPHSGQGGGYANPKASFGVAEPPLSQMRAVRLPSIAKTFIFFFFFFFFFFNFGVVGRAAPPKPNRGGLATPLAKMGVVGHPYIFFFFKSLKIN
jgi:hypothetical protein